MIVIYGILEALTDKYKRGVSLDDLGMSAFVAVVWPLALVICLAWLITNVAYFAVVAVIRVTGWLKKKGTK